MTEDQAAGQVLFCTVTALGLVRLLSQPKLMGTAVKSGAEASAFLQGFCHQPGVAMAAPDHAGWEIFYGLLRKGDLAPRHYIDAYLAALAIANGWRLVSFDRDFQRFSDLHWLALP